MPSPIKANMFMMRTESMTWSELAARGTSLGREAPSSPHYAILGDRSWSARIQSPGLFETEKLFEIEKIDGFELKTRP